MCRPVAILAFLLTTLSAACLACECLHTQRPCEYLRSDVVFVGRVIETVAVKHPMDKTSWSPGYSMRFAVDEPLRGAPGTEIAVETGNGGGDCGTPLQTGAKFLIFAYREKDGKLWTGMCSGNQPLTGDLNIDKEIDEYRALIKKGTGSIFGSVMHTKPFWRGDEVRSSPPEPVRAAVIHANSDKSGRVTRTEDDGSYEFNGLPNGKYNVVPDIGGGLDFDHEYEDRYEADVSNGQCANVSFTLEPSTRIRGHVTARNAIDLSHVEVVAIPVHLKKLNQFSGKWDFLDKDGNFDLWPLPAGDYYVGVNISASPKAESPFPPTYYPGVTSQKGASIVHVKESELKELNLDLPETAIPRTVHFVAIGLNGKPLRKIYIQLEDLRHPGDAASYVNVDLNNNGEGTLTIYSGYSYHLHGSHWVSYGNDWCSETVVIPAGNEPVEAKFVMDRSEGNCDIYEIDGLKR